MNQLTLLAAEKFSLIMTYKDCENGSIEYEAMRDFIDWYDGDFPPSRRRPKGTFLMNKENFNNLLIDVVRYIQENIKKIYKPSFDLFQVYIKLPRDIRQLIWDKMCDIRIYKIQKSLSMYYLFVNTDEISSIHLNDNFY